MPSNEIKTKKLTGNIKLITNPELIKVKTIKRKYVEQISFCPLTHDGYDPFEIVGQTQGYVIVKTEHGINKISISDYRLELIRLYTIQKPDAVREEYYRYTEDLFNQIPQLFED